MLWQPIVLVTLLACITVVKGEGEAKREDRGVVPLTAEVVQAVQKKAGGLSEADARKRWAGKVVEFSTASRAYYREMAGGDHAGQTMFDFYLAEGKTGKSTDARLVVYVKDQKDIDTLVNRSFFWDPKPVRLRGKLVVDYTSRTRLWMEDARIVRDPKEAAKEAEKLAREIKALQAFEKTEDGKAVFLTADTVRGMGWKAKKNRELAQEWNGKIVELISTGPTFSQKLGGRMLYNLYMKEKVEVSWGWHAVAVAYFTDEKDVTTLNNNWRKGKLFRVRGKMVVNYTFGGGAWIEGARLVRDPKEVAQEEAAVAAGRTALQTFEKTRDGKALVLNVPTLKGMTWIHRTNQELTKKWTGKTVEVTVAGVTYSASKKTKQGLSVGFTVAESPPAKWEDRTIVGAYFQDQGDIDALDKLWRPAKPFSIRGKLMTDEKRPGQVWLEEARLVKE